MIYFRYKYARTQLDLIFSPKFHKDFPAKYLTSPECGDGFWESTGNGNYDHPGVDAIKDGWKVGSEVTDCHGISQTFTVFPL